jgi:hypothetical protein
VYQLILTKSERDAIDWIGYRYRHGDDFRNVLETCMSDDAEWDAESDITFNIPESKAWEIKEIGEEDKWACFATPFVGKLNDFTSKIV